MRGLGSLGLPQELRLQRLFSTFANGLPGLGLLLQRAVTAAVLLNTAVSHFYAVSPHASATPLIIESFAACLLLVGLWTPVAGTVVAVRELFAMISGAGDPWIALLLATLGATSAMIGPGAWSADARLFGRREIKRVR